MIDSPWLSFDRPSWPPLTTELNCEVAIVGAGISGVATAYYLLTLTDQNVVLFDKGKVASGATGNNAGIAVPHIDKALHDLVDTLGVEGTKKAFLELDEAWEALYAIHDEIDLKNNIHKFAYAAQGIGSLSLFEHYMRECLAQTEFGRTQCRFLVEESHKAECATDLLTSIEFVPEQTILEAIKATDKQYIAAIIRLQPLRGSRMNSALFCYKVLEYLQKKFPNRLTIYENTEIARIRLHQDHQILNENIHSQHLILCTNGYTHFSIHDQNGPFTKLQDSISPQEGYLAGFPNFNNDSYAVAYINDWEDVPYWYFSTHNGLSILGGPEFDKVNNEKALELTKQFLKETFNQTPTLPFFWHGTMGYTENGLRWVGQDADHPHLWYNLACNGIGIVPAIAGAKAIAKQFAIIGK